MAKAFGGLGVTAGLAADRASMSGMSAGQQFFETDTNRKYLYNGSAWVLVYNNIANASTDWVSMGLTPYASAVWVTGGGQYRKMPDGFVVFRGLVKSISGSFFTMPVGFRPNLNTMHLCAASGGISRIDAYPTGSLYYAGAVVGSPNIADWVDLSGIRFYAG